MDRFGINLETTFEARADTLVEMCRRGFAEQMVLSQDASCYIDWIDPDLMPFLPQWHYLHLYEDVCPTSASRASPRSRSTPCSSTYPAASSRRRSSSSPSRAREYRDARTRVAASRYVARCARSYSTTGSPSIR